MKKKLKIIIPLILAVAALIVWRITSNRFIYAGTVEATEVDISSRVASTIASYAVNEGDQVQLNQKLVALAGEDYRLAQQLADDDYKRGFKLFQSGSIPKENFDHLRSQKELADLHVQWCDIVSPLQGTVLTKYHEAGEWVNIGTKLLTLANLKQVWCLIYVPEPMLQKLKYGQKLTATLSDGHVFQGVVTHINDQAEFTPKNVQTEKERTRLVYAVKVSFENPDDLLKPGMTLEANLPK